MVTRDPCGAIWPDRADAPPAPFAADRMTEAITDLEPRVRRIVTRWDHDPTGLVQILREVQEEFGYLPAPAAVEIARLLRIPYSRVTGVASFYSFMALEPRGSYRLLFSDNITDRMAGNERLMDALCHRLWVEPGKVSEDGLVSVGRTSLHRHVRPGPGAAGEWQRDPGPDR